MFCRKLLRGPRDRFLCVGHLLTSLACSATASGPAAPAGQGHAEPANAEPERPPPQRAAVVDALFDMVQGDIASKFDILAQTEVVDGWFAVAIDPPYREFPNVILFRWTATGWVRITEGLGAGVQPYPSPYLDLHVAGLAYDLAIGDGRPMSKATTDHVHSVGRKAGINSVIHDGLVHNHRMGRESYFLDRRPAHRALGVLYPDFQAESGTEPEGPATCSSVDYPPLSTIELHADERDKVLIAVTRSGQEWEFRWTGVDDEGLLIDGAVAFHWSPTRTEIMPRDLEATPAECTAVLPSKLVEELELRALQARHCQRTARSGGAENAAADAPPATSATAERSPHESTHEPWSLEVHVQVDAQGQAQYVGTTEDSRDLPKVAECVRDAFRRPYLTSPGTTCGERKVKVVLGSRY